MRVTCSNLSPDIGQLASNMKCNASHWAELSNVWRQVRHIHCIKCVIHLLFPISWVAYKVGHKCKNSMSYQQNVVSFRGGLRPRDPPPGAVPPGPPLEISQIVRQCILDTRPRGDWETASSTGLTLHRRNQCYFSCDFLVIVIVKVIIFHIFQLQF